MPDPIQFDPALKELLLRKTGHHLGEAAPEMAEEVPVVARLVNPDQPVDALQIVTRLGHVVTGRVPLNQIVELRRHPNVASLKASLTYAPDLAISVPEIGASPAALRRQGAGEVSGRGIIVGVVDWGCDFAHANFRDEQGNSRLLYLWDQRGGRQVNSPEPYGYGRELTRAQINAALTRPDPYTTMNYDTAVNDWRKWGMHGTHVLDIAAGNGLAPGAAPGVAPEADLIFVHLKGNDTHPYDTLGDSVRLLEAVHYILTRAGERPVVVNFSLGRTGGPKDGTTLVEQALDALLAEKPGRAICMSTGNYYTANLHSAGRLQTNETAELRWQALPRHDEIAEMEIWYPGADAISIELIDPHGHSLGRVGPGETTVVREQDRIIASVYNRQHDPNNGDNQGNCFLWPDAPVGLWRVRLHGDRVVDGRFHAWIERDAPASQSRFLPEDATPTTTMNTICSGHKTIAVGAYDARVETRPILPFSSAGPSRDGRQIPVLAAPGGGIRAARSTTRDLFGQRQMNGLTVKNGSSMAAPHVAGVVALMFEAAGARRLWADEVRQILTETARRPPLSNGEPRLRYGAGLVDATAAVAAARRLTETPPLAVPQQTAVLAAHGHERDTGETDFYPPSSAPSTPYLKGVTMSNGKNGSTLSWEVPPLEQEAFWETEKWPEDWPPETSDAEAVDRAAAVPDFTAAKRADLVPVFNPRRNADAIRWNQGQHPAVSGVAPAEIRAELGRYVDFTAVAQAIAAYNAAHPSAPIAAGTPPIDAVFVEAVHQFQAKSFAEAGQIDGKCGESTLDSLGLVQRTGLQSVDRANRRAQQRLNRLAAQVSRSSGGEFTAGNWFQHMVNPTFLGWRFTNGIHLHLARKLRLAERRLLAQPAYAGMTPRQLGQALGITERHRGARPTADSASMHTLGLATDINYIGNPWVGGNSSSQTANQRFTQALKNAALLISGTAIPFRRASAYFHSLGSNPRLATGDIYDELSRRNDDLRAYLRLAEDLPGIKRALQARRTAATPGVFTANSESIDHAAARWQATIRADLGHLRAGGSNFGRRRNPLAGFLNLHRDLVIALRDGACLAWGAVDFGPNASGDFMHFDCRIEGLGRILNAGYQPRSGHPCLAGDDREAVPEQATASGTTPAALATRILNHAGITLATWHSSGRRDNATARQNIADTANGRPAARSSYGNAPGGTVQLDTRLLQGILTLANTFTFTITELAGGSHSRRSRHYVGVAMDVGRINNQRVGASHPDVRAFMQACRRLGATEVLGPGDPGHATHVHCAWPRPRSSASGTGASSTASATSPASTTGASGTAVSIPYGGFSLQRGDRDDRRRFGGRVRPVTAGSDHVRQLQRDLAELGFRIVGADDGIFGRQVQWAVREFQIYAKMRRLAQESPPGSGSPARYVDRLTAVTNTHPYAGPISGVANADTRAAIQRWLANRWRCPVVVEAWQMRGGRRHRLLAENIWLHDEVRSTAPRMFVRDFSHYYAFPAGRNRDDLIPLGDYATYLRWSGPRSVPPRHTWPEAEILPRNLVGTPLASLTARQRSTYKVVRAVSEVECLGFFDSINAYDNAFVSLGPCHWTLGIVSSPMGEGELCGYLAYLRQFDRAAFRRAFAFFGVRVDENWVDGGVANGRDLFKSSSRKYAGWVAWQQESGRFARMPLTEEDGNYFKTWHWVYRFVMAGRTIPGFQRRMWHMSRIRLRDILSTPWGSGVPAIPTGSGGTRPATIGDVYTSERAIGMILRWHIRFPAHVISSGRAGARLRAAFRRARIPASAGDPTRWTDAHEARLIQGLRDEVTAVGRSGFTQSIAYVHDWPRWVRRGAANPRSYWLAAAIGNLDTARNSLQFDDSDLPPTPY